MVQANELNNAGRRTGSKQRSSAGFTVSAAAGNGPAQFEARTWGGNEARRSQPTGNDVGHAIAAALRALADVVEERGGNQVAVVAASFDEPAGSAGAVADIPPVLGFEEAGQGGWQVFAGQRQVIAGRKGRCFAELADALQHQTMILRIWLPSPPITQPMGL